LDGRTGDDEVSTILVVDDDPLIRDLLGEALPERWPGVTVLLAADGDEALRVFLSRQPDVVLLDVELPDRSGFEVLREIRQLSEVPVIMLTRREAEHDQVRGLQLGADDYVVKSQGVVLLTARIRAVMRRAQRSPHGPGSSDLRIGPLAISLDPQQVVVHERPVRLTAVEFKALYLLASNAGQVVTYDTLLTRIWGPESYRTADHLRVCVSRLQSKIERAGGPRCIENERGLGYRLNRESTTACQD
jgi:two-component system KDP operon response regulator KdpE